MANNINRVGITGNITRDAELRRTSGGSDILKMTVAINGRKYNRQADDWEDIKTFVDCVMFGSRAAGVAPYLPKGTKVAIDGHLSTSSWETKDGERRSKTEVVIDELEFMSRRDSVSAPVVAAPAPIAAAPAPVVAAPMPAGDGQAPAPESPVGAVYDEEIPF